MGNSSSILSKDQVETYENSSFFTKPEILKVLKTFVQLTDMKHGSNPLEKSMTRKEFEDIPELKLNPFKERISFVFSNEQDQVGFDEYLDFFSVFSAEATRDIKSYYAFKIYDFDDDGYICEEDVEKLIRCLVGQELSEKEIKTAAKKVFEEADLDGEGKLSFVEFEHVISRAHDFEKYGLYLHDLMLLIKVLLD